ncbi:MAG: hypothetical protein ACLFNN_00470 [Candidatus Paceibacterota bacterium]
MSIEKTPTPQKKEEETKEEHNRSLLDDLEKYKEIRKKEVRGELTEEEFDELLSAEFQKFLEQDLPIEGVFSPEEDMQKILELPRDEKKKALEDLKEKMNRQRKAWAICRTFIERSIEFNNDIPKEKLLELVERFGENYGFTDGQKEDAEYLMDIYYKKRESALDIRERFSDDLDLVEELTGIRFNDSSEFNVKVGPASIDIETGSENVAFIEKKLREEEGNDSNDDVVEGFFRVSNTDPPVYYTVVSADKSSVDLQRDRVHERQHIKNRIISAIFEESIPELEKDHLSFGLSKEKDPEERKEFLRAFLEIKTKEALDKAKDEITALNISGHDLEKYGVFEAEDEIVIREDLLRSEEERELVETYQRRYEDLVNKGRGSLKDLRNLGYTKEEAVYLLADKDLSEWPKTVKRIREQKSD